MEVAERDTHDEILAQWEKSFTEKTRRRLRSAGYQLVSNAT